MNGRLLYNFLCLATSRETPQGKIAPLEGIKLISALAHRHGIPVTWIVDSHSVQESRDILLQGHQQYSDDVILLIDIPHVLRESGITNPVSKAEETVILRQRLPEFISSEREKVRQILPRTEANVIAADIKTGVLIEVLEKLDCIGLWGYRWGKVERDTSSLAKNDEAIKTSQQFVSDYGCPWSFFYVSRDHYNAPAQYAGGLVAVENTSLDLNAVFHSGNPHIFSAEPNALRKSKLYADEDIAYPKALLDEYLKNCSWNRFLSFIQQQSAREMEYSSYDVYDRKTIGRIANILNDFFYEVKLNPGIQALNLPQTMQLYKEEFEYTESCYMAFDGIIPLHADIDFYIPPEPKQKPPYPFTFFYYDRECQLVFTEDQMTPVEMKNYVHSSFDSEYYVEKAVPTISNFRPARDRDKLIMEFEIESVKQMPFGLVIWDDHSVFSLVSTNARLVKWIGSHLLFIRMDLEEGLNQIEVSLTI